MLKYLQKYGFTIDQLQPEYTIDLSNAIENQNGPLIKTLLQFRPSPGMVNSYLSVLHCQRPPEYSEKKVVQNRIRNFFNGK